MMQGAAFKALTELCHSCFGFLGVGGSQHTGVRMKVYLGPGQVSASLCLMPAFVPRIALYLPVP